MIHADLRDTLFLLITWGGGTLLGGLLGRLIRTPYLGFFFGAAGGLCVSAILVAVMTWSNLLATSEPGDLVLLYLPPALMGGLVAAAIRETLNLYQKPRIGTNAEVNAQAHFHAADPLASTDAFCQLADSVREDCAHGSTPKRK